MLSNVSMRDFTVSALMSENLVTFSDILNRDDTAGRGNRHSSGQAYPAGNARLFANRRFRCLRIDPDDLRAGALGRTKRDAFEMTALRLTPVFEHDGDAHANSMRRELFKRMTEGAHIEDAQNLYPSPSINPA